MILTAPREALEFVCSRLTPLVPAKPADPLWGSILLESREDGGIIGITTEGNIWGYVSHPAGIATGGAALVPASRFYEMIRLAPKPAPDDSDIFTLDTTGSAGVLQVGEGNTRFSFPQLAGEVPPFYRFPDISTEPVLLGTTTEVADGLSRASYAMGGEGSEPRARMLSVAGGVISAYSSFGRAQSIRLPEESEASMLVPDHVVAPLVRFLRSMPANFKVFVGPAAENDPDAEGASAGVPYTVVSVNSPDQTVGMLAWPTLAQEFVDLTPIWRLADAQREGAATFLIRDWQRFVTQLRAARLAARPDAPVGVIRFSGPVLRAQVDDTNFFEAPIDGEYTGTDPNGEVAFSLDDMSEMLSSVLAGTDQRSALLYIGAAASASRGGRPFIQLVEEGEPETSPYRAVIAQADIPR